MRRGALAVVTALTLCSSASAATPTVDEFNGGPLTADAPLGITAGPDGNLWFTNNSSSGQIGRITPSGTVTEFDVPAATSFPQDIVGGSDGNLWFTEFGANKIGTITPAGVITEFPVTTATSHPDGITTASDGNLWFTEQNADKVAKIAIAGAVTEYSLPAGANPTDITYGPNDNLYVTEPGTNRIAKVSLSGTVTQADSGLSPGAMPDSITTGPDGNLWFTEPGTDEIGRMLPGGIVNEYALPSGSDPSGIVSGQDGNLWFTEQGTDKIGRITPGADPAASIVEFNSGLTSGAEPKGITAGPDGNLWFTELAAPGIGRINTALDPPAFQNTAPITIQDAQEASPYPSQITVSGPASPITDVTVRVTGLSHTWPDDVELLLVSPGGKKVLLMSDNGGGGQSPADEVGPGVNGITFNFSDAASSSLPDTSIPLVSGVFNPSQGTGGPTFPIPAPASPYEHTMSALTGDSANGPWKLFVNDDNGGDTGMIYGGWGLDIVTANAADDTASVAEDDTAQSILVGQNDDTVDGEVLNVSDPANGTATLFDGDPFTSPDFVEYTPDPNYCNDPIMAPPDTFTYEITGGDTATVSVTVTCSPDPAVANDDSRTVPQDSAATDLSVLANDVDPDDEPIEITTATDPAHGTATVVQGSPDKITYAPDAGYCNVGATPDDTFTYTVGGGDTATVSVAVTCTPPPIPNTTITKQPKKKLKAKKKATATFEFSSSLAGSTFACVIDGSTPSPCTSPKTYKLKKGKHTFSVTATAAGQKDPSPAKYSFKVKKKKRKG